MKTESRLLDEILADVQQMDEAAKKKLVKEAYEGTKDLAWVPNPGPQTEAFFCEADELYYGGEVGGGKSDLVIGLALTNQSRSLILRRFNDDARNLMERASEVVGHDKGLNRTLMKWPLGKKFLDFGGCQLETDKQRYKGRPHDLICVVAGTKVLMADGSKKSIETLKAGDLVKTLEGPKAVQKRHPKQFKPCVVFQAKNNNGEVIAEQVQSTSHQVLMNSGWLSAGDLDVSYVSNQSYGHDKPSTWLTEKSLSPGNSLFVKNLGRWHRAELIQRLLRLQQILGSFFGKALQFLGSGFVRSGGGLLEFLRLVLLSPHLSGRFVLDPQLSLQAGSQPFFLCGGFGVRSLSLPEDLMGRCSGDFHLYGERTQRSSGLLNDATGAPQCLLLLDDVELPTPNHSINGDQEQTQRHNRPLDRYGHPYTKEIRPVSQSGLLQSSPFSMSPAGYNWVYDLQVEEVNHYITDGGIVNKNCFDEAADFSWGQVEFITIWNRSADSNQRCRVVYASNPPLTSEGLWLNIRFAAWLDPKHSNPAKEGELRYYIRPSDDDDKEIEVDGYGPHEVIRKGQKKMIRSKSRTFIRSELKDNPDYAKTDYGDRLENLTTDLRENYAAGSFAIGQRDAPNQVIPTEWVMEAQERWESRPPFNVPMTTMGVDCSGGGNDPMVIARRYDWWFDELITTPGRDLPIAKMGKISAGIIVANRKDSAEVVLDMGGGYGGAIYERLDDNEIVPLSYKGAEGTNARTIDRQLGFFNVRSMAIWRFREALDPDQDGGSPIALPPSQILLADLTAPTFYPDLKLVKVENKKDIVKRLGRSTNEGDAVVMAWHGGPATLIGHRIGPRTPKVTVNTKRTLRGQRRRRR